MTADAKPRESLPEAARSLVGFPLAVGDPLEAELARHGAVLVEPAMLRRIIKAHRNLEGAGLLIPHDHWYSLSRDDLGQLAASVTVGAPIPALAELPIHVTLVPAARTALAAGDAIAFTQLWRAMFHSRIHQVLEARVAGGTLTCEAVHERIREIGRAEFEEARAVLEQEHLLLPPLDGTPLDVVGVYVELVALYLELRAFAPDTVAYTFPGLADPRRMDPVVQRDLDPEALLLATRPPHAPMLPYTAAVGSAPPDEPRLAFADPSARKGAARARAKGNRSRAAILAARAGDIPTARQDLEELVARLARALAAGGEVVDTAGWAAALAPVAMLAASHRSLRFNAGVRLLHDLQAACVVGEREDKVVDVVEWALSRGKLPIVRSLPATREVRMAKRLHAATSKLAKCEVESAEQRERLAAVLHAMTAHADAVVRTALRPKVEAALDEVALHPHSLPERVAEKTLVDELLDRAVAVGRLALGDLRDTLSHNDLKMHDLKLAELRDGDQLLRCDRLLARSLDGVYRRGEIYMRFLQKISSLLFGTPVGRTLTLYLMLPFLGSFAVLEGLQHMVGPLVHKLTGVEPVIASTSSLVGGAIFLFVVLHVGPARTVLWAGTKLLGRVLRFVLWTIPVAFWTSPPMLRFRRSILMRWGIKPALPALLVVWLVADPLWRWIFAGGVFLGFAVAFGSRLGQLIEERLIDWLIRGGRHFRTRLLPALAKSVLALFTRLLDLLDRGIYRVDEWLRFRQGQSRVVLVVKGTLGTVWFIITYFVRLYVDLFIEPTVNPIKHFPVVTVAAKLIIPFIPAIVSAVAGPTSQLLGPTFGNSFAAFTVLVLPGLAGFLVWELKENWKLYRATRPKVLRPLAIGHHGETIATFLRPGFHSGTLPKAYTRLRRAAWRDDERGVAKQEEVIHHVVEAIEHFADRQFVTMLCETSAFRANDVALDAVTVSSNRVQIAVACPSVGPVAAVIQFELRNGWLVVALAEPGWLKVLDEEQRDIAEMALAGFYKLSATDLVREQLVADDIARLGELGTRDLETLAEDHRAFGHEPLYWSKWATSWQQIARGEGPAPVMRGPSLVPAPAAARPDTSAPSAPGSSNSPPSG